MPHPSELKPLEFDELQPEQVEPEPDPTPALPVKKRLSMMKSKVMISKELAEEDNDFLSDLL